MPPTTTQLGTITPNGTCIDGDMGFNGAMLRRQPALASEQSVGGTVLADPESCVRLSYWKDVAKADSFSLCGHTLAYVRDVILATDPLSGIPLQQPSLWNPGLPVETTFVHEVCPHTCGVLGYGRCTALSERCEDPDEEGFGLPTVVELGIVASATCVDLFGALAFTLCSLETAVCSPGTIDCRNEKSRYLQVLCTQSTLADLDAAAMVWIPTFGHILDQPTFPPPGLTPSSLLAELCPRMCIEAAGRASCTRPPSPPPLQPPLSPPPPPLPPPPPPPPSATLEARGAISESDDNAAEATVAAAIVVIFSLVLAILCGLRVWSKSRARERLREQAAAMGLQPPTVTWTLGRRKRYACFLSHYKVEAGSDARFMREVLMKMLGVEVYLDSQNLTDLRQLMSDGVRLADVLLVLGTRSVLTRPWCLLEIFEAVQQGIPIELVIISGNELDIDDAIPFVDNLEVRLEEANPGAYGEVLRIVGRRRDKLLKASLRSALLHFKEQAAEGTPTPVWHSHASDEGIIADAKDIVEALARATEQQVAWPDAEKSAAKSAAKSRSSHNSSTASERSVDRLSRATSIAGAIWPRRMRRTSIFVRDGLVQPTTVYLTCAHADAGSHARVLQTSLANQASLLVTYHADRPTPMRGKRPLDAKVAPEGSGGPAGTVGARTPASALEEQVLVLLQTPNCLRDVNVLCDFWAALKGGKPIVPVVLMPSLPDAAKYDFAAAKDFCSHLEERMEEVDPAGLTKLREALGDDFDQFSAAIKLTLPFLISIQWDPHGSEHHLRAAVEQVTRSIRTKLSASSRRRSSANTNGITLRTRDSSVVDVTSTSSRRGSVPGTPQMLGEQQSMSSLTFFRQE